MPRVQPIPMTAMPTVDSGGDAVPVRRVRLDGAPDEAALRALPGEAPVAIEYNGIGYAVMMATPVDLEAFALGFSLSEGIIDRIDQVEDIYAHPSGGGWVVRIAVPADRVEPVVARARNRASESSCGLCGLDSIEQVLRPLAPVGALPALTRGALNNALATLHDHQPMGRATGATHAAAFCDRSGAILHAMEDVGRHNALDKLIGTLALKGVDPAAGFILLSARCSYELVEKTVRARCPMLVTISAPTSLAVDRAREAGLTLVALARRDSVLVFNDPHAVIA